MRIASFYHSLVSDWNHGNAHFLRGVVSELVERGHDVRVYEPRDGWSRTSLIEQHGRAPIDDFRRRFPGLRSVLYDAKTFRPERAIAEADLVLVHEWNDRELVRALGLLRRRSGRFRLLFHDTHHRSATAPRSMAQYDLRHYDGVLAYGRIIRDIYLERGWIERAWTWHEAADVRVFRPVIGCERRGDVVWIGNWGDGERTAELKRFLLEPVRRLGLDGSVFGVRYPVSARRSVERAGLAYRGWIANALVPRVFAEHGVTVHVPRRPYVRALPGIPTIRPFEALASGIPLVSAPWDDAEHLFTPGKDYLVAADSDEVAHHLETLLASPARASRLVQHGLRTIRARHTCAHRVDELMAVAAELGVETTSAGAAEA
ncbi:MAG: glycosyltransferase [Gaiellaceae bacterium]